MRYLALAMLLVCACHDKPRSFTCYKSGLGGGPIRECAPSLDHCDEQGCFEREEAYCFPYHFDGLGVENDKRGMMCTPSEAECKDWNEDRQHVTNRALGPCFRARVDEYVHLK